MRYSILIMFVTLLVIDASNAETWRGLEVAPENRCSPFDRKSQYPYPQSVEDEIVRSMGGKVYGPYTGRYFKTDSETDIEHIVSVSEGHDSGLCKATPEVRIAFATDPLNLTLAAPNVNRCGAGGKCGYDGGEWLPERNKCWFSHSVVAVRKKYGLTIDRAEATSLEEVMSNCSSFEMVFEDIHTEQMDFAASGASNPLERYDTNNNGKITCAEARSHGITPVKRSHPAYEFMYDRDGDGIVCE